MIRQCPKNVTAGTVACFTIAMLAVSIFPAALCHAEQISTSNGYALLIEQTPADAGFVTPELGVHERNKGDVLNLRAIPKPGYKFLYWLGDVEDTTDNETSVAIDSPKIIVAVFARSGHVGGGDDIGLTPGAGRTQLRSSRASIRGGGGGRGATPRDRPSYNPPRRNDEEVPEPTTLLTLGLGSLIAMRHRRKKIQ